MDTALIDVFDIIARMTHADAAAVDVGYAPDSYGIDSNLLPTLESAELSPEELSELRDKVGAAIFCAERGTNDNKG